MYASLISAGASTLYDLYKSATSSSKSSATSSVDPTSTGTADTDGTSQVKPTGSGSSFSSAIQKLLVDFQAGTSASGASTTSASDPHSLSTGLKTGGHHAATASSSASPFQNLATSLSAYAKTQNLSASASTSLTA